MRSKKAFANIASSLSLLLATIVCGLIVPRLIIKTYGSSTNGLIASISQFLSYIVLLEAGIGGVVRSSLYKFLASRDLLSISRVIKAAEVFFRRLSILFVVYLVVLAFSYPLLVINDFDFLFTCSLVLVIGISTFFQYYFGISYQILLQADQKQYLTSMLQLVTIIINTLFVFILVRLKVSIVLVKLISAFIYVIRPLFLNIYIRRKYELINNCSPDNESINQKWDGFGHHIAFFVTSSTDIVVLTIFANMKEVSVYVVYMMVISSVQSIVVAFFSGIEAAFGDMIAKNETSTLRENFNMFELLSFMLTSIFFLSTYFLILPFITLYTQGITDVNYIRPEFATIMILVSVVYCIRVPFSSVVFAAGHYRQTRNGAFIEASINIILSVLLVRYLGIVGVAIGTLCAMVFRTSELAYYLSRRIIVREILVPIKRLIFFLLNSTFIILVIEYFIKFHVYTYFDWVIYAVFITVTVSILTTVFVSLVYLAEMKSLLKVFRRLIVQ